MTRRRLNSIRLDKIAAVDQPCQEHATVAIVKRAPTEGTPLAIAKKTFQEALAGQLVSEKISDTFWRAFECQWAVRDAFRTALTDELAAGGDGSEATAGFSAAMEQIAISAATAARLAASSSDLTIATAVEEAVVKYLQQTQEQPMNITTKAQLAAAVASFDINKSTMADANAIVDAAVALDAVGDLNGDLAKMAKSRTELVNVNKALVRENAVLKMAPAVKAHYDSLAADQQDAFIAKSDADRQAEVDAAQAADAVIYKCADGTEIRKSDGAALLALAKRNDQLAADLASANSASNALSLEKRAREEFPNVALSEAVDMLKSVGELGADSDAGKAILKSLTTMNDSQSGLFKSLGTTEAPVSLDIRKARETFETEVSKVASTEKIGRSDAMSKVRNERPELFKAAYPEAVDGDEG